MLRVGCGGDGRSTSSASLRSAPSPRGEGFCCGGKAFAVRRFASWGGVGIAAAEAGCYDKGRKIGGGPRRAVKTGLQTELQYFYCAQNRKQQLDIEPAGWYTKDGQRKAATIEGG